jgi:uncharacterized integral membrane protein
MRYVYIALIAAITIVVLAFKVQNLDVVTVSLFSLQVRMPVALLLIGVYALGAVSGGFLVALVRSWIAGARPPARA